MKTDVFQSPFCWRASVLGQQVGNAAGVPWAARLGRGLENKC